MSKVVFIFEGVEYNSHSFGLKFGICPATIRGRLDRGWPLLWPNNGGKQHYQYNGEMVNGTRSVTLIRKRQPRLSGSH